MNEMEPWEEDIEILLRHSMSSAAPDLSQDFEIALMTKLDLATKRLDKFRRVMICGYILVSALASVVIMRGEGLHWAAIGALLLGPATLLSLIPSLLRLSRGPVNQAFL